MLTIQKTKDYSQFKFLSSNRTTFPKYIVESIQKKDMLEEHPIICTKDMYVIDGQNRLKAAEILNIPIYYIVSSKLDETDIPQCQIQNPWDLHNYLRFYQTYKDDYKFIAEIMSNYTFPIHFVLSVCTSQQKPYWHFREGKYTIKKDIQKLKKLFNYMNDIVSLCKEFKIDIKISANCYRALWKLINLKDYKHDQMLQKCKKYKDNIILSFDFKNTDNIFDSLQNRVYDFFTKKERLSMQE